HHAAEHQHEHHRLKERLHQQRFGVSPRDLRVAPEQSHERFPIHQNLLKTMNPETTKATKRTKDESKSERKFRDFRVFRVFVVNVVISLSSYVPCGAGTDF